jgi:hypothetical protein
MVFIHVMSTLEIVSQREQESTSTLEIVSHCRAEEPVRLRSFLIVEQKSTDAGKHQTVLEEYIR